MIHRSFARLLLVLLLVTASLASAGAQDARDRARMSGPVGFVANAGQIVDDAGNPRPELRFATRSGALQLYFASTRISYVVRSLARAAQDDAMAHDRRPMTRGDRLDRDTLRSYRVDLELVGARDGVVPEGLDPTGERVSYYLAHLRDGASGLPVYRSVLYRDVYPSIDLRFATSPDGCKYDFIVRPGGRVSDIVMRYRGADSVVLDDDGRIRVATPLGELVEAAPVSFVRANGGEEQAVSSHFLLDGREVRFDVADYDSSHTLVIDPEVVWATYVGGSSLELHHWSGAPNMAAGTDGSVTVGGITRSTNFPTSAGALQTTIGGVIDAVLVRLWSSGARAWSTYVGGSGFEYNAGISIGPAGAVYSAGHTESADFPVSAGAHSTTRSGQTDNYILKLDSAGARVWATYFGGSAGERGGSIALDAWNRLAIVASTRSNDIATTGAFMTTVVGTEVNVAVARFDSAGTLLWCTLAGEGDPISVATDRAGGIYYSGRAFSGNLALTAGAYQTTLRGTSDAFLGSFDSTGSQRWATLIGGDGFEQGFGIATDSARNVSLVGMTQSTNFPTTSGAFQSGLAGGSDGFAASFTTSGTLRWSTYYGGAQNDNLLTIIADSSGTFTISGGTHSSGVPVTSPEINAPRGGSEALFVKLDSTGGRLWATRFGGSNDDETGTVARSGYEEYVVAFSSSSTDVPTTTGAFQTAIAGSSDLVIARICALDARVLSNGVRQLCPGDSVVLTAMPQGAITWSTGSTARSITVRDPGAYWYHTQGTACDAYSDTITVARITASTTIVPSGALTFCQGGSVRLDGGAGHRSWLWSTGATTREITVSQSGTYHVTAVAQNGCRARDTVRVVVHPLPVVAATASALVFCPGDSVVLEMPAGYAEYRWSTREITRRIVVTEPGTYTYGVTDANGCRSVDATITLRHYPRPVVAITPERVRICPGDTVTLAATPGFARYAWSNGATTPAIRVSAAGAYSLTVVDSNGCRSTMATATVTMYPAPDPIIVPGGATTICAGDSLLLYSSKAFSSYRWSTGATGGYVYVKASGTYSLAVVDSNGCRATTSIDVTVREAPMARIAVSGDRDLCAGSETLLDVAGYGTVVWSNGMRGSTIRVRESGRYWADVVDASGCRGRTDTVTITVRERPVVTLTGPVDVCRESEAAYAATQSALYAYAWSIAGGDGAIVGPANLSTVRVRWGSTGGTVVLVVEQTETGCRDTVRRDVSVGDRVRPAIAATPSPMFCPGGSVVLDAGPGYGSYRWTNGETTQTITVSTAGRYSVFVETGAGCSGSSDPVDVAAAAPPTPRIDLPMPAALCPGGSIRLTVGEFTEYRWSTGERTRSIDVTTAGTYSVTVRDRNGCSATSDAVTITDGSPPIVDVNGPRGACPSSSATYCASDAALADYRWAVDGGTITAGDGTSCITVLWGGSAAGGVRVSAIDPATGCRGASEPLAVSLAGIVPPISASVDAPCTGDTVVLDAGSEYASYRWSTGEMSRSIRVTTGGTYEVSVADAVGCSGGAVIDVTFGARPLVAIASDSGSCAEGRILDAGPGHATYAWSTGESTRSIRVTLDGSYSVVVGDGTGCDASASIDVRFPSAPSPAVSASGPLEFCRGDSVTLVATAGYAGYRWSTGADTREIVVRDAGSYTVDVVDDRGCRGRSSALAVIVTEAPDATIMRGRDSLHAAPGAATYRWSRDGETIPGATGRSIQLVTGGRYRVTVVGTTGCSATSEPIDVEAKTALVGIDTVSAVVGERFIATLSVARSAGLPGAWSITIRYPRRSLFVHDVLDTAGLQLTITRPSPGVVRLEGPDAGSISGAIARFELEGLSTAVPLNTIEIVEARVGGVDVTAADGLVILSGCAVSEGLAFGRAVTIHAVSPNPASHLLTVRHEAPVGVRAALTLRDIAGREIIATSVVGSGAVDETQLDVADVPSGHYVVELRDRAETSTATVVITR